MAGRTRNNPTIAKYILCMLSFFLIGGAIIAMGVIQFSDSKKTPIDFNTITVGELKEGMVLEGDLEGNFGCFMESYRTKYGIKTGSSTYYYMIPVGESQFMSLQGHTKINDQLDRQADKVFSYFDSDDITDFGTVHIKGKLKKMSSEDKGYLKDYMKQMGYTNAEIGALLVPYTFVYSTFDTYGVLFAVGGVFLLIGLIYGVAGITGLKKKKSAAALGEGYVSYGAEAYNPADTGNVYGGGQNPQGNSQNVYGGQGNPQGYTQNPYNSGQNPQGNSQNVYNGQGNPQGYNQNPYNTGQDNPQGYNQNPYNSGQDNSQGYNQNPYNGQGNPQGNNPNPYSNDAGQENTHGKF